MVCFWTFLSHIIGFGLFKPYHVIIGLKLILEFSSLEDSVDKLKGKISNLRLKMTWSVFSKAEQAHIA